LLEAFEDSGVSLPAEKRDRFKRAPSASRELAQEFSKKHPREQDVVTGCFFALKRVRTACPRSRTGTACRADEHGNMARLRLPRLRAIHVHRVECRGAEAVLRRENEPWHRAQLEILDEIVALRKEIDDLYEVPSFGNTSRSGGWSRNRRRDSILEK